MFQIRGKCVICTQRFVTNNIAALHCGHVFHYDCIQKWFERSLTCPNCRAFTTSGEIVRHLFFDAPDDFDDTTLSIASPGSRADELLIALGEKNRALLQAQGELREKNRALLRAQNELRHCETTLAVKRREYDELLDENLSLKARIEILERSLEKSTKRLKACELYKIVTSMGSETALDTLLGDDGSLRMGQFINIQKRQLEEAKSIQRRLREELRAEREQLRASKKKESDLEKLLKNMEIELRDARAANTMQERPLKQRLRNLPTTHHIAENRETADIGNMMPPKRNIRRPLVERRNESGPKRAHFAEKEEEH
ncbi:unnamed protein product [Cylicocyclus nassatus]|uniref:RING-type domain-containing protein n=1 Tax=Cylicocyclus nassatus TaxID=53992 RepID=A0AA36M2R8_CYLNA|nr:unnamed protein product [Cylicocyclus nassatus]